jgi:hypothetical protein
MHGEVLGNSWPCLANSLLAYRNRQITNWELQDQLELYAGIVPEQILEQLDLLYDDFPEKYLECSDANIQVVELLERVSLFLNSDFDYERSDVSPDGCWPFTQSQFIILQRKMGRLSESDK